MCAVQGELTEFIESEDSSESERPETLRSKIPQGVERLVEPWTFTHRLSKGERGALSGSAK